MDCSEHSRFTVTLTDCNPNATGVAARTFPPNCGPPAIRPGDLCNGLGMNTNSWPNERAPHPESQDLSGVNASRLAYSLFLSEGNSITCHLQRVARTPTPLYLALPRSEDKHGILSHSMGDMVANRGCQCAQDDRAKQHAPHRFVQTWQGLGPLVRSHGLLCGH